MEGVYKGLENSRNTVLGTLPTVIVGYMIKMKEKPEEVT